MPDTEVVSSQLMPSRLSTVTLTADGRPTCGARKKSGKPCMLVAGYGTTHHGYGACKYHLGITREANGKAARQQMEDLVAEKARLGDISPDADPEEVLMQEVARAHRAVDAFDSLVQALTEEEIPTQKGRTVVSMWNKQRELLAAVARIALQAGIAERQTQVLEVQAIARRLLAVQLRQTVMAQEQRDEMYEIEAASDD